MDTLPSFRTVSAGAVDRMALESVRQLLPTFAILDHLFDMSQSGLPVVMFFRPARVELLVALVVRAELAGEVNRLQRLVQIMQIVKALGPLDEE